MTGEPTKIYLGTITRENPDETFVVDVNADPDVIIAALEAAEQAKREAAAQETERLKRIFLGKVAIDK